MLQLRASSSAVIYPRKTHYRPSSSQVITEALFPFLLLSPVLLPFHTSLLNFPTMSSSPTPSLPSLPPLPSKEEVKEEAVAATKGTLSSFRSLAAGGVGGIFAVLVGHPFDLVKVRLQTAEKGVYTGAIDVVKKTIAKDGARVRFRRVGCDEDMRKGADAIAGAVCRCFCTAGGSNAYV